MKTGGHHQHPTTPKHDDRNLGYFEEAKTMVLKFDQSEAQLNQPPEARQVAPERARARLRRTERRKGAGR
jgi:hypothetical protein